MIPVIISGGYGTKLWPLSRQEFPKQFLPLINGRSLFQLNFEALTTKFSPNQIFVSTNASQAKTAQAQIPQIPVENYLLEPEMRNQGPATGLIAAQLYKLGMPDEPFMIIQVDDIRLPVPQFIKMVETCDKLARQRTEYITGGFFHSPIIYGNDYLEKGEQVETDSDVKVYRVAKFVWRKNQDEIEKGIASGSLLVHTNHTCMTPKNFMAMLKKYRLDWYTPLSNIINGSPIEKEYPTMPSGPIEEVTELVHANGESLVVEIPFEWIDIGTWESLALYYTANNLNKVSSSVIDLEGKNNYVHSKDSKKVIALVGVDDLVVVDTGDALLVCKRNSSAKVTEVVKEIHKRNLFIT